MKPTRIIFWAFLFLFPKLMWSQCDVYPTGLGAYICNDNGTPADPSDDTFTIDITMGGDNVGVNFNVFNGTSSQTGSYGIPLTVGPIDLANAPLTIGFTDVDNPNCVYSLYLDPGVNCQNVPCAVISSFENYICDDGGTPTDPTDDTFTVDLNVQGINTSSTWTSSGYINDTGPYGIQTYGPFTVYTGVTGVQVTDDGNANCFDFATLFSPGACSNGCIIDNVFVSSVQCDDNGTPNDPSDDAVSISIFPLGNNLGTSYSITSDVGTIAGTSGLFDQYTDFDITNFQPAEIISLTVTADDDPTCTYTFDVAVPSGCGEANCMLTDAGLISFSCNDFGTPGIGSDDFIDFVINPVGVDLGSGFIVTSDDGMVSPGFGVYNQNNAQSIMGISNNPGELITITITDMDNPDCFIDFQFENITPCEVDCDITGIDVTNITCFNNGTSTPVDDVYTFFVEVDGVGLGSGWTADDPFSTFGPYNSLVMFGPFNISDGTIMITITDNDDPTCNLSFTVDPPAPCSSGCTISTTIQNIICDDNSTPNNPNDDVFFFDIIVNGSGNSWLADDSNSSSGNHNEVVTLGPYNISLGVITFNVFDAADATCFTEVTVSAPGPCSIPICNIESQAAMILCNDNGTPNDDADDTFTFEVTVTGNNTGANWIANDANNTSGSYGVPTVFGPYLISDGTVNFTITDMDDPTCATQVIADPPAPCSIPICNIESQAATILCNDNGTPNDDADDTFTFEVTVTGNNTGANWIANDPNNTSGSYGVPTVFGPYLISDGTVNFTIADVDDPNCATQVTVNPPAPCSIPICNIESQAAMILCNDNGTPNDDGDDTFTFEVTVSGNNTGANWIANDPNNTSGSYNILTVFGPYLISDGTVNFTITDVDDPNCTTQVTVNPPAPCSIPICNIESQAAMILCNDNGTPNDDGDDTFTFEVTVTGNNTGANWIANDANNTSGSYGVPIIFGPFLISDGTVNFTIADVDDPNCTTQVTVNPPAPCSIPICNIESQAAMILCNDNGTPNDDGDDTFTFEVTVSGNNTGANWIANDANNTSGSYGVPTVFGPYLISDGTVNFTITDMDDPNCTTQVTVDPPAPCSIPICNIESQAATILCNDNGTPNDDADDTFTFEVTVSGNNTGANWIANDANNTSESYGVPIIFGPFLISDGTVNFTIADMDDPNCTTQVTVNPPAPCSIPICNIESQAATILCNDNGTPNDDGDDTFTFEVTVSGNNTGANWIANDVNNTSGSYNLPTVFGPFLIGDGTVNFTIDDMDDPNCTTIVTVNPPAPCSIPICNIESQAATILCNDNGTPNDDADDTFTFEITVTGNNTGANWIANDANNTSGPYGVPIIFGPYLISDGTVNFTITDMDDPNCTTQVTVDPPDPCSECSELDPTIVNETSCNQNFIPEEVLILEDELGCDSTVIIQTIYEPLFDAVDTLICANTFWSDGLIIQNDTIIVDTLDIAGCDLITTYNIGVRSAQEEFFNFEFCEGQSIIINDEVYNEENSRDTIVIVDSFGCDSIIQYIELTYSDLDIEVFSSDVICFDENNGQIEIAGTGPLPLSLVINDEEAVIDELPYTISGLSPDIYFISVVNEDGCIKEFEFEIFEGELLTVELEGEVMGTESDTILLEATVNSNALEYNWTIAESDSTCVNCSTIQTAFISEFVYGVSVLSELGCSARDAFSLNVESENGFEIPNVFSPNGDNLNDLFTIGNTNPNIIRQLKLQVFDRWGNLVFVESAPDNISWDGQWGNIPVQPGVFIYFLELETFEGTKEIRKGDITVLR